jgi:hypothetical protein
MKFSIRDIMLLTVIVALAAGWGVDRSWQAASYRRREDEMRDELRKFQSEMTTKVITDGFEIARLKKALGEPLEPLDEQYHQSESPASALTPPRDKRP